MRKIIYTAITFIAIMSAVCGQNVGINTDEPKHTLSIEGNMRVKDMPKINGSDFVPLSRRYLDQDEANGNDQNIKDLNNQIITSTQGDTYRPIRFIDYRFELDNEAEDWVNGIDLGFPTDKYTVILADYALVDADNKPVYLEVLGRAEIDVEERGKWIKKKTLVPLFSHYGFYRGGFGITKDAARGATNPDEIRNDFELATNIGDVDVVAGSPLILAYPLNGSWHFYADYPAAQAISFKYKLNEQGDEVFNPYGRMLEQIDAGAIDRTKKYAWEVTFMVIDHTYMTKNETPYEIKITHDAANFEGNIGELDLRDADGKELDPVTGKPIE